MIRQMSVFDKQYTNGNTTVIINTLDGSKIRYTDDDEFLPQFAEAIDMTITYKCDGGCQFCYAGCSSEGKHANLISDYVVNTLVPSMRPYTEVALNGNDLSHPHLEEFLKMLRENRVIANLTVNQKHFMSHIGELHDLSNKNLIHGLGVSLVEPDEYFISKLKEFPNAVIHTIAGILSTEDIKALKGNNIKLLILGYKVTGRGDSYYTNNKDTIDKNMKNLKKALPKMIKSKSFKVICFDTLALEQLSVRELLDESQWKKLYQGEEGSFTYFIDLVNNKFAKNSIERDTYDINGMNALQMFKIIQGER